MAKKSGGKTGKAAAIALPDELGGGAISVKALVKHPLVAELAAQALEAMAADIRAKLAKPAPKPVAAKKASPKAAKPAAPRRKPTAPGTDTTQ